MRQPNMRSWTPEEDSVIMRIQSTEGRRWGLIAQALENRSSAAVRNRWIRIENGEALRGVGKSKNRCTACGEKKLGHICGKKFAKALNSKSGFPSAMASPMPICTVNPGPRPAFDLRSAFPLGHVSTLSQQQRVAQPQPQQPRWLPSSLAASWPVPRLQQHVQMPRLQQHVQMVPGDLSAQQIAMPRPWFPPPAGHFVTGPPLSAARSRDDVTGRPQQLHYVHRPLPQWLQGPIQPFAATPAVAAQMRPTQGGLVPLFAAENVAPSLAPLRPPFMQGRNSSKSFDGPQVLTLDVRPAKESFSSCAVHEL